MGLAAAQASATQQAQGGAFDAGNILAAGAEAVPGVLAPYYQQATSAVGGGGGTANAALQPYQQSGYNALDTYDQLLGLPVPKGGAQGVADQAQLMNIASQINSILPGWGAQGTTPDQLNTPQQAANLVANFAQYAPGVDETGYSLLGTTVGQGEIAQIQQLLSTYGGQIPQLLQNSGLQTPTYAPATFNPNGNALNPYTGALPSSAYPAMQGPNGGPANPYPGTSTAVGGSNNMQQNFGTFNPSTGGVSFTGSGSGWPNSGSSAAAASQPTWTSNGNPVTGAPSGWQASTNTNPGSPGGTSQGILNTLNNLPGYQFALQQGAQAVTNNAASKGLLNSTPFAQGLTSFGQGMAQQNYNSYVSQMAQAAGMGQQAATQQGTNAINTGTNLASLYQNQGTASANSVMSASQAEANAVQSAANIGAQGQVAQAQAGAQAGSQLGGMLGPSLFGTTQATGSGIGSLLGGFF